MFSPPDRFCRLNRVPGPCLTIAQIFRPSSAPTWRPRTPCCQSDEGCDSSTKRASPHCACGNGLDPNLGTMTPLATFVGNDRGSAPRTSPIVFPIQLAAHLYECTNKMVLSTKSAEQENIKGCGSWPLIPARRKPGCGREAAPNPSFLKAIALPSRSCHPLPAISP